MPECNESRKDDIRARARWRESLPPRTTQADSWLPEASKHQALAFTGSQLCIWGHCTGRRGAEGEPRFALQRPLATSRCARDDLQKVLCWSVSPPCFLLTIVLSGTDQDCSPVITGRFPSRPPSSLCSSSTIALKLKRNDFRRQWPHEVLTHTISGVDSKRSWRLDFEFWTKRRGELSLRWAQRWCSIFKQFSLLGGILRKDDFIWGRYDKSVVLPRVCHDLLGSWRRSSAAAKTRVLGDLFSRCGLWLQRSQVQIQKPWPNLGMCGAWILSRIWERPYLLRRSQTHIMQQQKAASNLTRKRRICKAAEISLPFWSCLQVSHCPLYTTWIASGPCLSTSSSPFSVHQMDGACWKRCGLF